MFIEGLTGADTEPVATGKHLLKGGRCLRKDGRVIAIGSGSDAGAEVHVLCGGAERAHPRPDKGTVALFWRPRLEVVRGHGAAKACLLCLLTPGKQFVRAKLFQSG